MLQARPPLNSKILSYTRTGDYLHITTDNGQLKLQPYTNSIIRITYTLQDEFSSHKTLGIIAEADSVDWDVSETEEAIELSTDSLHLSISRFTSAITYRYKNGKLLLSEANYDSKLMEAFDSYKTILDEDSVIKIETADGIKDSIVNAKKSYDRTLYHTKLQMQWQDGEALYGMGQHEEGILNLRGHVQYGHQANMKIAIPFLLSTNNYGLLLDTYSPTIFNDNEFGSYLYTEAVEELDYYFIHGDNFDQIISGYRSLTGQAAMLPRWAFGYMQSFERYESADELIATVEEYRNREIPLDSIVLDWQSWEGEKWGQKTFDNNRFPDPKAMTDKLHDLGAHFMISIWPNMRDMTPNNQEFKEKGGLFQQSDIYDAFDQDAKDLYWKQTKEGLFDYGVDAWWTDSCEPFAPEWSCRNKPEPGRNFTAFHETARTYMDETLTNAYAFVHSKTIFEGQRNVTSDKRVTNLTRSGYTGQQRFGNIFWSGDIAAKWSTLKNQIAAGLNFCASGLPYWTLDIGAFFVKHGLPWFWDGDYELGNQDPAYRELYTRWFQYATFLPVLRAHGTDTRREVWQFGEEGSPHYDAIVKFIKLRYKLMPYIYSLAGMVTQRDYTMLRLLAFDYGEDSNVYDIDDQFMFGNALMICPVTEASSAAAGLLTVNREVYLPKGSDWYDYWTGDRYEGGQMITASASIDAIPIFVPSGAVIPMTKPVQYTKEMDDKEYDLHIYTGHDGSFTLYLDEGDNYNYENGAFATVAFDWIDSAGTLKISDLSGGYAGLPEQLSVNVYIDGHNKSALIYDHKALTLQID